MNIVGVELVKGMDNQVDSKKTEGREAWSSRLDFFFAVIL